MLFVLLAVVAALCYLPTVAEPRDGKEILFLVTMLAAVPFLLTRNNWLRALFLWALGSFFWYRTQASLNELLLMLLALALLKHGTTVTRSTMKVIVVTMGMALCLLIGIQALGLGPANYVTTNPNRPFSGFTQSTADTAAVLAIIAPLAVAEGWMFAALVLGLGMAFMQSSIALVALLAALAVIFWKTYRSAPPPGGDDLETVKSWRRVWGIILLFGLSVFATTTYDLWTRDLIQAINDDRWHIWGLSLQRAWSEGFWFKGLGLASYQKTFGGLQDGYVNGVLQVKWFKEAHNEWVQIIYELGLVGFLICLGAARSLLRKAWRLDKGILASLVAALIVSFGHFTFHLVICTVPVILLCSQLEGDDEEPRNP